MRRKLIVLFLLLCTMAAASLQAQYGRRRREPREYFNPNPDLELRQLFPRAATLSPLAGSPRHSNGRSSPCSSSAGASATGSGWIDVGAVSRASLSIGSATRAIRDSSRLIARALLNPGDVK